jgi:hypothetical protein
MVSRLSAPFTGQAADEVQVIDNLALREFAPSPEGGDRYFKPVVDYGFLCLAKIMHYHGASSWVCASLGSGMIIHYRPTHRTNLTKTVLVNLSNFKLVVPFLLTQPAL